MWYARVGSCNIYRWIREGRNFDNFFLYKLTLDDLSLNVSLLQYRCGTVRHSQSFPALRNPGFKIYFPHSLTLKGNKFFVKWTLLRMRGTPSEWWKLTIEYRKIYQTVYTSISSSESISLPLSSSSDDDYKKKNNIK